MIGFSIFSPLGGLGHDVVSWFGQSISEGIGGFSSWAIDGVIHAIELNCLAGGRLDDSWMAQQGGGMAADLVETIEVPGNAIPLWRGGRQHQGVAESDDQRNYANAEHS